MNLGLGLGLNQRRRRVVLSEGEAALRANSSSYHVGADWSGTGPLAGRVGGDMSITAGTKAGNAVDLTADGSFATLPAEATPTYTATTGQRFILLCFSQPAAQDANDRLWSCESADIKGEYCRVISNLHRPYVGGTSSAVAPLASGHSTPANDAIEVIGLTVDNGVAKLYRRGLGLSAGANITGVGTIIFAAAVRIGASAFTESGSKAAIKLFSVATGVTAHDLSTLNLMADEMATVAA